MVVGKTAEIAEIAETRVDHERHEARLGPWDHVSRLRRPRQGASVGCRSLSTRTPTSFSLLSTIRSDRPARTVKWHSPLQTDGFKEISRSGCAGSSRPSLYLSNRSLKDFWPTRGTGVVDAIGTASDGSPIFVEAKAHIPEAASLRLPSLDGVDVGHPKKPGRRKRCYAPKASRGMACFYPVCTTA